MRKFILKSLTNVLFVFSVLLFGQTLASSTDMDPSFNTKIPLGFNYLVDNISMQSDGKLIIYGDYSIYQGANVPKLLRINADGTRDTAFAMSITGFHKYYSAWPFTIAAQNDGKLILAGTFDSYKGTTVAGIARLNTDGSLDTGFNAGGGGFNNRGIVNAFKIQNDGKILVGGSFTHYNGSSVSRLIRLNTDGSRDTGFNTANFNYGPTTMTVQPDGKILVGGQFTYYGPSAASKLIRLNSDGSIDTGFNVGGGFNDRSEQNYVASIVLQADGKIVVGGDFATYKGVSSNGIIRLNSDGSIDTGFNVGVGFNTYGEYVKSVLLIGNKILVGGKFTTYQGAPATGIISLNMDGSRDTNFLGTSGLYHQYGASISKFVMQPSGKIVAVGQFTKYNGLGALNIMSINPDGSRNYTSSWGDGFDNSVQKIEVLPNGKSLVAGSFTAYSGVANAGLVRLNRDGSLDSSFRTWTGFDNNINKFHRTADDKIMVLGSFTNKIARLNNDGSLDSSFNPGTGFNSNYLNLDIQDDGKIVVGGSFTNYNGTSANKLIRLNTDGSIDTGFNIGSSVSAPSWMDYGFIREVKIQNDGKIVLGGLFTSYNGTNMNSLVRLNANGSRDTGFNIGGGIVKAGNAGDVYTLNIQDDGKILVGGSFTTYNGSAVNNLVRLNTDGSRDVSFNVTHSFSEGYAGVVTLQTGNKILVAGLGASTYGLVRLNNDGSLDTAFSPNTIRFGSIVRALATRDSGEVLVGGDFLNYKGAVAGYLVTLYGDAPIVNLPNSTDTGVVHDAFTTQGYTSSGSTLIGSTPISLSGTDGNIPTTLDITNQNLNLNIPGNTQIKQGDNTTNYSGVISTPVTKNITSVNDQEVIVAFNVGSNSNSITLAGGSATLSIPVPGQVIGSRVNVYYSLDNGVTWYFETTTQVISKNGEAYVEFTTNHFGDFAITKIPVDITSPTATVSYDISSSTNQNVVASVSDFSESITGLNTATHTFTSNGSFTFTFEDLAGNTGSVTATVNWIDKSSPIITIIGNSSINITQGDTYTDAGASASDNVDGDITANIVTSGSVDTAITGTYVITYNVSDAVGNNATEATRYITVSAKGAPTATVNYNITGTTDQDVIATITGFSEAITGLNATTHTFTANGTFVFTFQDMYGNPGSITANVSWIDKTPASNGGGGGGGSPSATNLASTILEEALHGSSLHAVGNIQNSPYSEELNNAYLWAFFNDITTMDTIQKANMEGTLIRKDMAKMISNFAINILKKTPSTGTNCTFSDTNGLSQEYKKYITLACALGLMGFQDDGVTVKKQFNPEVQVDRGQFGTILSRVLRGDKYNGGTPYFSKHLNALKAAGIMTKIATPLQKEIRGYVMLMMMRSMYK